MLGNREDFSKTMKRIFDFIISSLLMVACLPIMLLVALLIKIDMGSPIFFTQVRAGLYGSKFCIYKFRTMRNTKDDYGKLLDDSARITKLGSFLRKFSLDELPQLYNVSRGDMSLVGPRPLLMEYLPYYSERELIRHMVRPGITGLAQISGRNLLSWDERLALDVKYVTEWTLELDWKILFRTFWCVAHSKGVVNVQDAIMLSLDQERKVKRKQWPVEL